MKRLPLDEYFLIIAKGAAERSTCPRAHVGAVLVNDKRIVSTGYSGSPPGMAHCEDVGCRIDDATGGCIRTIHAEQNAINFAARKGIATEGCSLYCTHTPCLTCAKSLIAAGIVEVYAVERYRDIRGAELLEAAGVPVYVKTTEDAPAAPQVSPDVSTPVEELDPCKICGEPIVRRESSSLVCANRHYTVDAQAAPTVGVDRFGQTDRK